MAPLVVLMLATGCTAAVGGDALPAVGLKPRPLTGQTITQVLLDAAALSKLLHQSFKADPHLPPRFGGPETLQEEGSASPADCLGVAFMLRRHVYQSANIQDVAVETWSQAAMFEKVIGVKEGVVSLPTAGDADALFVKFSQQWQQCDGTTLLLPGSVLMLTPGISNVRVANSVLAASVSMTFTPPGSRPTSMPEGRAIGVRGNCLIEIKVDFFIPPNPSRQGSGDVNTPAVNIAHAMMDKVSELS
ncbi:sensor domain-containing protein [Mycobacterium sp.]|uniref:sensor domain-containing protein n=1 Tax=Mycobacterium sp. TaxID=1785 RepID=UPI003C73EFBF